MTPSALSAEQIPESGLFSALNAEIWRALFKISAYGAAVGINFTALSVREMQLEHSFLHVRSTPFQSQRLFSV